MLYIPNFFLNDPIFGTKSLSRRRFLQHYYRDTFIESHRKPRDVPQMCYRGRLICSMLALIPQSGDFSGAALGVRSVALLQVAELAARRFCQNTNNQMTAWKCDKSTSLCKNICIYTRKRAESFWQSTFCKIGCEIPCKFWDHDRRSMGDLWAFCGFL